MHAVIQTYWKKTGTDSEGNTAYFAGATPLSAELSADDFVDFTALPEATVIGWIKDKLGGDDHYNERIQAGIDEQTNPVTEEESLPEPISTALTGIALARQGIEWLKANVDAASDAKAMAAQLTNVFQGHKDFNKQRYDGTLTLKEVAEQRIEMVHQEKLMELRTLIDLRMGHGFYDSIQRISRSACVKLRKKRKSSAEQLYGGARSLRDRRRSPALLWDL